jgi:hypothetical protein
MIYSCFNEKAGHYEYFEDSRGHAMNGDLPVPSLSGMQAGSVGVPARDAGRPLPAGAKRVGTGWAARGMIVQCRPTSVRSLAGLGATAGTTLPVGALIIGGGLAVYGLFRIYMDSMQKWGRR